jgi:hypothetical protein
LEDLVHFDLVKECPVVTEQINILNLDRSVSTYNYLDFDLVKICPQCNLSCIHILYLDRSVTNRTLIWSKYVHNVIVMHPHTGRGTQEKTL